MVAPLTTPAVSFTQPTSSPSTSSSSSTTFDKDAFLKLLVAQMRYQDPSKPMDGTEFIAQSAQFTTVEALQNLQTSQNELLAYQSVLLSSSLVGKTVTGTTMDGSNISGQVSGVHIVGGSALVQVDGKSVPVTSITDIQNTNSGIGS
jgi:flagellar basal-body rod modification protein FlgD